MVSILNKEKNKIQEGEEPWESTVHKGELVVPIPKKERRQVKSVTPNYRLYHDPEVVLYADPVDVAPLEEREAEYLLPVYPASVRLKEYLRKDELKMKMNLMVGDAVTFKLELGKLIAAADSSVKAPLSTVRGTIRYIGLHHDNDNNEIFFGIEIDPQVSCINIVHK